MAIFYIDFSIGNLDIYIPSFFKIYLWKIGNFSLIFFNKVDSYVFLCTIDVATWQVAVFFCAPTDGCLHNDFVMLQTTGEQVAIKTFNSRISQMAYRQQFQELSILQRVEHPNIVKFITMEQEVTIFCGISGIWEEWMNFLSGDRWRSGQNSLWILVYGGLGLWYRYTRIPTEGMSSEKN